MYTMNKVPYIATLPDGRQMVTPYFRFDNPYNIYDIESFQWLAQGYSLPIYCIKYVPFHEVHKCIGFVNARILYHPSNPFVIRDEQYQEFLRNVSSYRKQSSHTVTYQPFEVFAYIPETSGKYVIGDRGTVIDAVNNQAIPYQISRKPFDDSPSYNNVSFNMDLSYTGGKLSTTKQVHVIIAYTFIGPDPDPRKKLINHIDNIKIHNFSWNLEWVTYAYNRHHGGMFFQPQPTSERMVWTDEKRQLLVDMVEQGADYESIMKAVDYKASRGSLTTLISHIKSGDVGKSWEPYIAGKSFKRYRTETSFRTPEVIEQIKAELTADPYITYVEIAEKLGYDISEYNLKKNFSNAVSMVRTGKYGPI